MHLLFASIRNRFYSFRLELFSLFMNVFIQCLTILSGLMMLVHSCIQSFRGFITKNPSSLINVLNNDFNIEIKNTELFKLDSNNRNYNNPDVHDMFHIYLSKLLYESNDQIKEHCKTWGFSDESIEIYTYIQSKDLKKYTYSTKAVVLQHNESNTIIIAFRGTEPMDLTQWLTNTRRNFIDINHLFNNMINTDKKDDKIRVHAGFYHALGLDKVKSWNEIDWKDVTKESPMVIQLLDFLKKFKENDNNKYKISITGHGLGGALASLFSFVLLCNNYESSISGVYTYGQPLVGNRIYANILNRRLGNQVHRWVNHNDIFTRIPNVALPSTASYYGQTSSHDASEAAANISLPMLNSSDDFYWHSGLRLKINREGNLVKNSELDRKSILGYEDGLSWFDISYGIHSAMYSFVQLKLLRSLFWLIAPVTINDHLPGDYAKKIECIVKKRKKINNCHEVRIHSDNFS